MTKNSCAVEVIFKVHYTFNISEEVPNDFYIGWAKKMFGKILLAHEIFPKIFDGLQYLAFVFVLY